MCAISVFSRATAALQHQRQDQGARHPPAQDQWPVSTNFFSSVSSLSFASSLSHVRPFYPPLIAISLSSQFSYSSLYSLHIPHGPLFPVHDPLRRVSPGQVLETRGFHLIWTGSPFFAPSRSLLPSAFLPLALHGRSLFLPLSQPCFPSFLPSKRNTSFDPVNEGKCEGKITPQIGNTGRKRLEKSRVCLHCTHFIVPFITLVYSFPVLNKLIYKINFSGNTYLLFFNSGKFFFFIFWYLDLGNIIIKQSFLFTC